VHPPPMLDPPTDEAPLPKPPAPPKKSAALGPTPATGVEIPDGAVPTREHSIAELLEEPELVPTPAPTRVQSVTSEVEEVHEFEAPKLPSIAPPVIAATEETSTVRFTPAFCAARRTRNVPSRAGMISSF